MFYDSLYDTLTGTCITVMLYDSLYDALTGAVEPWPRCWCRETAGWWTGEDWWSWCSHWDWTTRERRSTQRGTSYYFYSISSVTNPLTNTIIHSCLVKPFPTNTVIHSCLTNHRTYTVIHSRLTILLTNTVIQPCLTNHLTNTVIQPCLANTFILWSTPYTVIWSWKEN